MYIYISLSSRYADWIRLHLEPLSELRQQTHWNKTFGLDPHLKSVSH